MFIIRNRKTFIIISATLMVLALASLLVFGMRVGIDFKGGSLSEVVFNDTRPMPGELLPELEKLGFGQILLQGTGGNGYIVKSRELTQAEHMLLLETLSLGGRAELTEIGFNSIGPSVGKELARKAIIAVILVSLGIILFIAFVFRGVSKSANFSGNNVPSWKYGLIAVVTLLHDVAIPTGIFVFLSRYGGAELDALFVVAALTILGLSVSDTIVVFDRIRENLNNQPLGSKETFSEIVGRSVEQSFARSIATSLTVILVLLALFFFGPVSTKYFALMLTAGMFFGTYSSIFLASPLLVLAEEFQHKK